MGAADKHHPGPIQTHLCIQCAPCVLYTVIHIGMYNVAINYSTVREMNVRWKRSMTGAGDLHYAMRPLYGFIHEPRSVTSDVQAIVPLERAERLLKMMGQSVSCSVDVGIITDQSTMCIDEWRGGG